MELRHLRYFVAVAEELNFTRAAEKMFTVQPSLSQQIRDLEEELGVSLIIRANRRKVTLTPEGEVFLTHAKNTLESAKLAISAVRQVANNRKNQFYIGFLNVAEIKIMSLVIDKIKEKFPETNINIQSLPDAEQIHRLKNNQLDLTFTRYCIEDEDFSSILLLSEKILMVGSNKFFENQDIITPELLNNQPIIICEQNASPIFFEKINDVIHNNIINPSKVIYATNLLQHINLINMSFGISFIPEYAVKYLNEDIKILEPSFEVPLLDLYANFKYSTTNPALDYIAEELKTISIENN
ncbi:LysR family transcriptional regulator [Acinetobacter sp. 1124_18A]|uniref:LysR family transcriptional regulator n=1 Tax=Acinetobacter sp. 1124_18A TaxID=2605958 RepID=UPI003C78B1E1